MKHSIILNQTDSLGEKPSHTVYIINMQKLLLLLLLLKEVGNARQGESD